jgi:hypothetical protein
MRILVSTSANRVFEIGLRIATESKSLKCLERSLTKAEIQQRLELVEVISQKYLLKVGRGRFS